MQGTIVCLMRSLYQKVKAMIHFIGRFYLKNIVCVPFSVPFMSVHLTGSDKTKKYLLKLSLSILWIYTFHRKKNGLFNSSDYYGNVLLSIHYRSSHYIWNISGANAGVKYIHFSNDDGLIANLVCKLDFHQNNNVRDQQ